MTEPELIAAILLKYGSMEGIRLFRNSVGEYRPTTGGYIRYGLCVGSSDIIGIKSSGEVGLFVAIEVKASTTRTTPAQLQFIETIRHLGGLAGIARSVEDAGLILFPSS